MTAAPISPVPLPAVAGGREWRRRTAGALAVVAALHLVAFGTLFVAVIPGDFTVGGSVFGIGLALTAYVLGVRHAFDADHLAAIDNTTRTLVARGRPSVSVGLFFSLGHSSVVFVMAVLVAAGASVVSTLVDEESPAHQLLGVVGTSVSGLFLVIIGLINLAAFLGILRVWRQARGGELDEARLERALDSRGLLTRLLRPALQRIRRPGQMYPLGFLFGLGFDTATEISLLVLAGTGAATGLPWYAVLVLPLLFASGMSLFDTLDGAVMQAAYRWSVIRPIRRMYVNLTTTGLSVAVALIIGLIELVSVIHERAGLTDPLTSWIAGLGLDLVGYLIVAAFLVVWGVSMAYWRFGRVEERWSGRLPEAGA